MINTNISKTIIVAYIVTSYGTFNRPQYIYIATIVEKVSVKKRKSIRTHNRRDCK